MNMPMIKFFCDILDVEKKGTKENVVERLLDFLLDPQDSGKKVPAPKKSKCWVLF